MKKTPISSNDRSRSARRLASTELRAVAGGTETTPKPQHDTLKAIINNMRA